MNSQPELRFDIIYRFKDTRDRLYAALRDAASKVPHDHIVLDTNSKNSSVSHGMRREKGHRCSVDVLAYLLVRENGPALLDAIAEMLDQRVVPKEMSDSEWRRRMEPVLERHGDVGAVLRKEAGVR